MSMACQASGNNFLFTFEASYVLTLSNNIRDLIFKRGSFTSFFKLFCGKTFLSCSKKSLKFYEGKIKGVVQAQARLFFRLTKFSSDQFFSNTHILCNENKNWRVMNLYSENMCPYIFVLRVRPAKN